MASSTVRRITPKTPRNFGKIHDDFPVPDLTEIQTRSYDRFLQADLPAESRQDSGFEGVFSEIFPIESYDKTLKLEYIKFDLGKPRYEPDECRQLRSDLRPPSARLAEAEQGRGQGHRGVGLPGRHADHDRRRRVHHQRRRARGGQPAPPLAGRGFRGRDRGGRQEAARLPRDPRARLVDRASGHEEGDVGRPHRPVGQVLVDDAAPRHEPGKFSSDDAILRMFYESESVETGDPKAAACSKAGSPAATWSTPTRAKCPDRERLGHLQDPGAGAGRRRRSARSRCSRTPRTRSSSSRSRDDPTTDHESALLRIYQRLRPGNPPQLGEGPRAVPREVLRHQPLPFGQGRPLPDQPQVRADHPRRQDDARPARLRQRDQVHPQPAQEQGARRRHRPPGQPPPADDRRAGRRRAAQGLPQAPPAPSRSG